MSEQIHIDKSSISAMHTTNYIMSTSDQKLYTECSFCAFDGILLTQDLKAI